MYCPSCDKSYGAVHSRCPECHSWLKVSAPANQRSKIAKSATAASVGSVSTLDKEPALPAWSEPPTAGVTDWAEGDADSWSDAIPTPSPSMPVLSDPAPVADGAWGAGGDWSGTSASDWGGAEPTTAKNAPAAPLAAPIPPAGGGAWLSGDAAGDDGWGGSKGLSAPAASPLGANGPATGLGATSLPIASSLAGSAAPTENDGWGGGAVAALPATGSNGAGKTASAAPSGGWLGGHSDIGGAGVVEGEETSSGWLGDSRTTTVGNKAVESDGWLGGEETSKKAPSMTEMVDRAIGVEEADDFVDDSWVDEEVNNGEYDDLETHEYTPATPEVGGLFLKMLLVAVLVLFIGGGIMFLGQEKKTPEQIKAEERNKELLFARSSVENATNYLKKGTPLLAIGPLEAAVTSLKTAGGSEKEILETKAKLARALMKAQEYQKAYGHWAALAKGPEAYRKEAKGQMTEASKQLRAQATAELAEAAAYIKSGESTSVLALGRSALKIFEQHKGTASQKGKAYGVIGRGYFNGKEYGNAKASLKKALALNPAGGYQSDLALIAAATAPRDYYYDTGGGYSDAGGGEVQQQQQQQQSAQPTVIQVDASIDGGSRVPTASGGGGYSGSSSSSSSNSAAEPASTSVSAAPRTREIPAFQRSNSSSGSTRRGQQGVIESY